MFSDDWNGVKCPCKGCADREIGCHGKCERYAAFKEENARVNHERYLDRQRFSMSEPKKKWLQKQARRNGKYGSYG